MIKEMFVLCSEVEMDLFACVLADGTQIYGERERDKSKREKERVKLQ